MHFEFNIINMSLDAVAFKIPYFSCCIFLPKLFSYLEHSHQLPCTIFCNLNISKPAEHLQHHETIHLWVMVNMMHVYIFTEDNVATTNTNLAINSYHLCHLTTIIPCNFFHLISHSTCSAILQVICCNCHITMIYNHFLNLCSHSDTMNYDIIGLSYRVWSTWNILLCFFIISAKIWWPVAQGNLWSLFDNLYTPYHHTSLMETGWFCSLDISYHIVSYHIKSYIIYFPSVDPYRIT